MDTTENVVIVGSVLVLFAALFGFTAAGLGGGLVGPVLLAAFFLGTQVVLVFLYVGDVPATTRLRYGVLLAVAVLLLADGAADGLGLGPLTYLGLGFTVGWVAVEIVLGYRETTAGDSDVGSEP